MQNPVYNPLGCQVKLFPRITDDSCLFCDGRGGHLSNLAYGPGIEDPETVSVTCEACYGTGKDDPELYLIMTGKLKPPAEEVEL